MCTAVMHMIHCCLGTSSMYIAVRVHAGLLIPYFVRSIYLFVCSTPHDGIRRIIYGVLRIFILMPDRADVDFWIADRSALRFRITPAYLQIMPEQQSILHCCTVVPMADVRVTRVPSAVAAACRYPAASKYVCTRRRTLLGSYFFHFPGSGQLSERSAEKRSFLIILYNIIQKHACHKHVDTAAIRAQK